MLLTLDRFEGDFALLVDADGEEVPVPRAWIPEGCGEGAALRLTPDPEAQEEIREKIRLHQARFQRGGDIDL